MTEGPSATPLVGAVRVLRTFRVSRDGRLLSTTTAGCTRAEAAVGPYVWSPGDNSARCPRPDHAGPVPGVGCSCGFYGYADEGALLRSDVPGCHDLMAVVALTGRVIPARRGARGEHARIEALWLSRRTSERLADPIRRCYPRTAVYTDRSAMLAEFPLSRLPGQRLRHGPSRLLLALQTVYFLAVWIVPLLLTSGAPRDDVVDTRWGYLALGLGVLGSSLVPALRQLSRYWWTSALPTPVLFAVALTTTGVPGLLATMALLGAGLAGIVWEVGLFLATHSRVGRRLSILDLEPTSRTPWPPEVRADVRDAVPRLLLVVASATAVGLIGQERSGLTSVLLVAGYLVAAVVYAVLTEKAQRHRIALALLATGVVPPLLHGLPSPVAALAALAGAAALFGLGYVYLTPAGQQGA
jgi:hypothetical protein